MEVFTPGVYATFEPPSTRTISGVGTSTTAMVGIAEKGPTDEPVKVNNFTEFAQTFGGFLAKPDENGGYLAYAAYLFFQNGGKTLYVMRLPDGTGAGELTVKKGASIVLKFTAKESGAWIKRYLIHCKRNSDSTKVDVSILKRDATSPDAPSLASVIESYPGLAMDEVQDALAKGSLLTAVKGETVGDSLSNADAIKQLDADAKGTYYTFDDDFDEVSDGTSVLGAADVTGTLDPVQATAEGKLSDALTVLKANGEFAIVAFPGLSGKAKDGQSFAKTQHGDSFFIADPPKGKSEADIVTWRKDAANLDGNEQSALYYPWLRLNHPETGEQLDLPPSGAVAGIFARTDNSRGVFKAPAGTEAVLNGVLGFETKVSNIEQEDMNKNGVNAMRAFAGTGNLIWGARTLGDLTGPFRYVPVMRYFLYLRKSLIGGTQFAVFEPNDERLWTTLRMTAEAFMMREFRKGAFQGTTPEACFFVKCDSETNPQAEIDAGFVNLLVGYAPLKPAEFVMIRISHKSASAE